MNARRDDGGEHDHERGYLSALGHSETMAGWARLLTVIASILGPAFLGLTSWAAGQAYSAFNQQREKLEEVRLLVNTMNAQKQATDASITAMLNNLREEDNRLLDHEKRITRVEALIPIANMVGPQKR